MIKSTLSVKAQTTIPKPVRAALQLRPGDEILYEIEDGTRVVLSRLSDDSPDDPFASFTEWSGAADHEAYADL